jgi:hypothetical protein
METFVFLTMARPKDSLGEAKFVIRPDAQALRQVLQP